MPTRWTVRPGDTLSGLAARFGFGSADDLHAHPDNAELKQRRPKPEQLLPGDVVIIPDREPRAVGCATGAEHRFRVKLPTLEIKLRVVDQAHEPLAGKEYRLEAGELRLEGRLGDDGLVDAVVPATVTSAVLRVWLHPKAADGDEEGDLVYELGVGHLDPEDEVSGVQGRLLALGYAVPTSGALDDATRAAIEAFERRHGLDVTGEPSAALLDKLKELHDA